MTNIVGISVQANESAIYSAQMLFNLRKIDDKAQGITKLTHNMVGSVGEMEQHSLSITQYANDAQHVTQQGSQSSLKANNGM